MQWVCSDSLCILKVRIHRPLVLHPCHKLKYFENVGWEESWATTAKGIVRAEFNRKYASMGVAECPESQEVYLHSNQILFFIHLFLKESSSTNIFDNLPALSAPSKSTLRDDLDRYLNTDPEDVKDPLQWWYEHKHIYPHLHRMALDYLSIPGKFL